MYALENMFSFLVKLGKISENGQLEELLKTLAKGKFYDGSGEFRALYEKDKGPFSAEGGTYVSFLNQNESKLLIEFFEVLVKMGLLHLYVSDKKKECVLLKFPNEEPQVQDAEIRESLEDAYDIQEKTVMYECGEGETITSKGLRVKHNTAESGWEVRFEVNGEVRALPISEEEMKKYSYVVEDTKIVRILAFEKKLKYYEMDFAKAAKDAEKEIRQKKLMKILKAENKQIKGEIGLKFCQDVRKDLSAFVTSYKQGDMIYKLYE